MQTGVNQYNLASFRFSAPLLSVWYQKMFELFYAGQTYERMVLLRAKI